MNESTQADPHSGSLDLMIAWLGDSDKEKVDKATSILLRLGQPVVEYLVQAAVKRGRRPEHVCRIVDLVRQIGGPLGVDEMFAMQSLLRHRDPAVCEKAEQVIMAASPCGVPDSPAGIAAMRAINPFLQAPPARRPPRRTRP